MSIVAAVHAALLPVGLNLIAVAPMTRYDREVPERFRLRNRHPDGKSLIVIGNGGGAFWNGFRRHGEQHPDSLEREPHPLDAYTVAVIERTAPPLLAGAGLSGQLLFPFRFAEEPVSFMHLAAVAGLGARSLLGVLVHPEYGPWIALRAAVLLEAELETSPTASFDPCPTCVDKPCVAACPGQAVTPSGWDVPACTGHRLQVEHDCQESCHARLACIYGQAHRYPADALAYHQRRALAAMRALHAA